MVPVGAVLHMRCLNAVFFYRGGGLTVLSKPNVRVTTAGVDEAFIELEGLARRGSVTLGGRGVSGAG